MCTQRLSGHSAQRKGAPLKHRPTTPGTPCQGRGSAADAHSSTWCFSSSHTATLLPEPGCPSPPALPRTRAGCWQPPAYRRKSSSLVQHHALLCSFGVCSQQVLGPRMGAVVLEQSPGPAQAAGQGEAAPPAPSTPGGTHACALRSHHHKGHGSSTQAARGHNREAATRLCEHPREG